MNKINSLMVAVGLFAANLAQAKTVEVHVNGMVCAFCGQGITKKFNARPEVEKVDVSLKDKVVKLNLKDKADIGDDEIRSILKDSGYQVEKIERQ